MEESYVQNQDHEVLALYTLKSCMYEKQFALLMLSPIVIKLMVTFLITYANTQRYDQRPLITVARLNNAVKFELLLLKRMDL